MVVRREEQVVAVLLVVVVAGTYAAARSVGAEEALSTFLPLLAVGAFVAYRVAVRGPRRVAFRYPVYLLRNADGLTLCTAEPDGGYLAVFTESSTAEHFREVRHTTDWLTTPIGHAELLAVLGWATDSGRVQYVMVDPLSAGGQITPVLSLSDCVACVRR